MGYEGTRVMRKINVIYTVLLCLAVFTLSACNTTGSSRPWIYNPDNAPKAKQPPEPLSQTLPGVTREPLNQQAPLQGSAQIDDGVNIGFDTQRMPTDEQQNGREFPDTRPDDEQLGAFGGLQPHPKFIAPRRIFGVKGNSFASGNGHYGIKSSHMGLRSSKRLSMDCPGCSNTKYRRYGGGCANSLQYLVQAEKRIV